MVVVVVVIVVVAKINKLAHPMAVVVIAISATTTEIAQS